MNGNGTNEQICEFFVFFSESKRGFCKATLEKTGTLIICVYENGEQSPTKKEKYVKFSGESEALYLANLLFYAADDNALYNENLNIIEKEIDKLNIPEYYYNYEFEKGEIIMTDYTSNKEFQNFRTEALNNPTFDNMRALYDWLEENAPDAWNVNGYYELGDGFILKSIKLGKYASSTNKDSDSIIDYDIIDDNMESVQKTSVYYTEDEAGSCIVFIKGRRFILYPDIFEDIEISRDTLSEITSIISNPDMMVDFDFNDWYDFISINLTDRRICGEFLGVDYWLENGDEVVVEPIAEL